MENAEQGAAKKNGSKKLKFYILEPPQYTSELVENNRTISISSSYYKANLNEESAEIWLHRGFESMTYEEGHTNDPKEASVFLIAGYAHLYSSKHSKPINSTIYHNLIVDPSKPHLLLMPTWNPNVGKLTGIRSLAESLQKERNVTLWSVGFERNGSWQGVDIQRILPIPYVVRMPERSSDSPTSTSTNITRKNNFVFYAGASRTHAQVWGGCYREKMTIPLSNETNMFVKTFSNNAHRLKQSEYNQFMENSDYCLILCGDTPTSRSITSAMVAGCIPIRIGSRLRGLCDPPCFGGWGWTVTGANYSHLPYEDRITWSDFPEVDEGNFTKNGSEVLSVEVFQKYDDVKKDKLRKVMEEEREGWIYGWGDPVSSMDFGRANRYILDSFQSALLA
eukprot:scaffold421282_cov56-Attheya_sp.AAC.5